MFDKSLTTVSGSITFIINLSIIDDTGYIQIEMIDVLESGYEVSTCIIYDYSDNGNYRFCSFFKALYYTLSSIVLEVYDEFLESNHYKILVKEGSCIPLIKSKLNMRLDR